MTIDRDRRIQDLLAARLEAATSDGIQASGDVSGPLSSVQQSLWIMSKLSGGAAATRPTAVRLRGPIDPDGIAWAWSQVVERHSILRSTFPAGPGGEPIQVVHPAHPVALDVADLSGLPAAEREGEARRIASEVCARSFDVEREIPVVTRLLRLGDGDWVLVLGLSHLVFDGWSERVLHRELGELCGAWSSGSGGGLAAPPIQYLDYARWERNRLPEDLLAAQLDHWTTELRDAPDLRLPFGGSDDSREPVTFEVGEAETAGIADAARQGGATMFMALLAALHHTLGDMTGDRDVVVGVPTAGRARPETEELIGCFINTLLIRADLSSVDSFDRLLAGVRRRVLVALQNQDVPYSRVLAAIRPWGPGGHAPLYRVHFQLRDFPVPPPAAGVDISAFEFGAGGSGHALAVRATPHRGGLGVSIGFDPDLISRSAVEDIAARYSAVLDALASGRDPIASRRRPGGPTTAGFHPAEPPTAEVPLERIEAPASLPAEIGPGTSSPGSEHAAGVEQAVADIFGSVLAIADVDGSTDFFEAGGHSLLAIRLIAGLRARLGYDLALNALFIHRTVADVARLVATGAAVGDQVEAVLDEVGRLSDEDAAALLALLAGARP